MTPQSKLTPSSVDAAESAETDSGTYAGADSAAPCIIGYAAANRILRYGPGIWHALIVVRHKENSTSADDNMTSATTARSSNAAGCSDDATANADLLQDCLRVP